MDFIRKNLIAIVALFAGLGVGLLYAYMINPVEWTNVPPDWMDPTYKKAFVDTTANLYSYSKNPQDVTNAFIGWSNAYADICAVEAQSPDPGMRARYNEMARVLGGQDCSAAGVTAPTPGETQPLPSGEEAEGGNGAITLLLLLILVVLGFGIVYVLMKRRSVMDDEGPSTYYDMPESGPISDEDINAVPLARFPSNYTYGRDNFDDSHSIENTNGDFLGECGIGIAESIGADSPKNVTAFEVWLFDKNDIRTVTKVIMSDHAYFDDALKAKLAPKGEPVLARENEVIVLETAALIINAEIKEMKYGEGGALPPQSYFETFTIELSAWAKHGGLSAEPDVQGRVDELLEY